MLEHLTRNKAMAALAVLAALVALAIATNVSGTRVVDLSAPRTPVVSRAIVFKDAQAGGIAVFDQGKDQPFDVLPREENRFMATALRLLANERVRRSAAGPDAPFMLTKWSDGQLSFSDPATGETLDLAAFGHTNAATFARLLTVKGSAR